MRKLVFVCILLDEPEFASSAWLVIELCSKDGTCIALLGIEALHIVYARDKTNSWRLSILDRICVH